MTGRFAGKVAVVTGAASGIGAASARQLAAEGARVVVVDVDEDEAGGQVVADDTGGSFERLDVSDPDAWGALVERLARELGGVDLAHLNAGVLASPTAEQFLETPIARHRLMMGVNLGGVVFGIHALAPAMLRRGGGAIVATASIAGLIPYGDDPTYAATKHGVVGLVRSVAPQLGRAGVRVHAICPGGVDTPLVDERRKQEIVGEGRPLLAPEQVAAAVADLLARDDAGIVQTIDHEHGVATVDFPRRP